jgi:hypothetical protein
MVRFRKNAIFVQLTTAPQVTNKILTYILVHENKKTYCAYVHMYMYQYDSFF